MSSISYFNQLAGKGNNDRILQFNVYQKIFKDINKKILISKNDYILDLGGGTGELTGLMAPACRQIILADGAEKTIEYAGQKLKSFNNISFRIADILRLPLPFSGNQFDKVVCYSVIHYAASLDNFYKLILDLIRITKPGGKILIGDIPLDDKYRANLQNRKNYPVNNFLLNQKYYIKKYLINLIHRLKKIDASQVKGLSYTKEAIEKVLGKIANISYEIMEQGRDLPLADSREDLLIVKKTYP